MAKKILIAVGVVVALIGLYAWGSYNGLVSANEAVNNQWAQVETQYQRRFDLIPNLVAAVKGILKQEQSVFKDIADARSRYSGATTVNDRVAAANQVESALGRLLVITENYPQLNSAQNIRALQDQLEGTENRISVERERYNNAVQSFNLRVKGFPGKFFASLFGFSERAYFQSAAGAAQAPKVEL